MINLVNTYHGEAELVVCGNHAELLDEVRMLAPDASAHLVASRHSTVGSISDHRRAFRSLQLDLLQVTLCNPFAARPAMLAAFSARIPVIAVEQLVLPSRRRRGRILKNLLSRPLAGHVAVGTRSADDLKRFFGVPRPSVTVIHNGVPPSAADPIDFDDRPVIGCAARLEDQKSLHVLVEAMAELPDVRLVLVGDGERRPDLEAPARELAVADRVEFAGWKDDACPYIAGFDVFVLPSHDESFPLTIVEAMLARTPVVASDVGSVSDAITDGATDFSCHPATWPPYAVPSTGSWKTRSYAEPSRRQRSIALSSGSQRQRWRPSTTPCGRR